MSKKERVSRTVLDEIKRRLSLFEKGAVELEAPQVEYNRARDTRRLYLI